MGADGLRGRRLRRHPAGSSIAHSVTGKRRHGLRADAPETQLDPRLANRLDDITIRKTRVGAFTTTDLDRQLRDRDVDTLLLAGISTDGGSHPSAQRRV